MNFWSKIEQFFLSLFGIKPAPPPGTIVGAIRWDGWVDDGSTIGAAVDKTLGPNQYHNRLPFYAQVTGTDSVIVNGATQAIVDQEISYAHSAGLNYLVFGSGPSGLGPYPEGSGLGIARDLYLSSSLKHLINFSIFLSGDVPIQSVMNWLTDPSYQKVLGGCPLIYFFNTPANKTYIPLLRSAVRSAGLANPYIVLLDATVGAPTAAATMGVDAVSEYSTTGSNAEPYASLVSDEVKWWTSASQFNSIIPWVTSGWDPRPRIQNPVSWATYSANGWVQDATPTEIANHLQDAFNWIGSNLSKAPANTILMYAWNEFDEGGWLCPTFFNGPDRLQAIAKVLKNR